MEAGSSVRGTNRVDGATGICHITNSSGLLRSRASRFELHAVRDPVRAAFLFVRQCRRMTPPSRREQQRAGPRRRGSVMATGTVKWCNDAQGFGFITPEGGEVVVGQHPPVP